MNHANAALEGIAWGLQFHRLTTQHIVAVVIVINTGEDAHEGGFARAVFTYQGMNFALAEFKIDLIECLESVKMLGNVFEFNNAWLIHALSSNTISVKRQGMQSQFILPF